MSHPILNPEQLEALLIDRELGELSPAVAALLETHLHHDATARQQATAVTETLHLARLATAAPLTPPRRALDIAQLRRAEQGSAASAWRREALRLAACLALGLGLGWLLRTTTLPAGANLTPSSPAALAAVPPAEPRSLFWSAARLTASHHSPAPTGSASRRPLN